MLNFLSEKQSYEILIVCIISGIGMIISGNVLDKWRRSSVFDEYDELWIIVTPLLGLKGNIEMTLACRLSTMVKLGEFKQPWKIGYSNLIIIQVQGLIVGLGAAIFGYIINFIFTFSETTLQLEKFIRLAYISLLTASISSLILGIATIIIVYHSWKLNFDPDIIATPLAAVMGDTITIFILYYVSRFCPTEKDINFHHYLTLSTMIFCFLPYLLSQVNWKEFPGWIPILSSMILSSLSGWILKKFVFSIKFLATLQPLVNGIGGNIGSIFCSSLSTDCHRSGKSSNGNEENYCAENTKLFGLLIILSSIIHTILLLLCRIFNLISFADIMIISCPYFATVFIQILVLLCISQKLVNTMWHNKINPDNGAIPIITGLGDLLGTSLLSITFSEFTR